MTEFPFFFAYSEAQWNDIKAVVKRALSLDADRIERRIKRTLGQSSVTETQSLRSRIEDLADRHILRSAVESQTPGHKARIQQLNALRGRAEALRRVQLKMLEEPQRKHPFYWAAFILSGAWTPLAHR